MNEMGEYRFDDVVMLLSTDWFLPHWSRVGLNVPAAERVKVQEACRITVGHIVARAPSDAKEYWLTDFSPERVAKSHSLLRTELSTRQVPAEVIAAIETLI